MDIPKKRLSIGIKMYTFVVVTVLLATIGVCSLAYAINSRQIDRYFKSLTINTARNFSAFVDPEFLGQLREVAESDEFQALRKEAEEKEDESMIEDYLKEKGLWDGYVNQRELLIRYLRNMKDIKYLYLIAWGEEDSLYDMYLIDDDDNPIYETGYYEEREKEFYGVDISAEIEPVINNGKWGWLCSGYAPVYDKDGNLVCHVGCDVGMEDVMHERRVNLMYILICAFVFMIIILTIAVIFVKRWVVKPLNMIASEMGNFYPGPDKSYEESGVVELDIKSKDEIEHIYQTIRSMQINIVDYINDIIAIQKDKEKAEDDIRNKDEQIGKISKDAYKDSLTGVGTKAAYTKMVNELNSMISDDMAEFGIVMVDVNLLKMVNDNYGHSAGDKYLRGCCHVVCEVFKHSPVFRIGGDEFVVILTGDDYENRLKKMEDARRIYEESYNKVDLEQWKRFSASIGMAEYEQGDTSVEMVFKRADKYMYEEKMKFKKKNGIAQDVIR